MEIIKIEENKAEINLSEDEIFAIKQEFFMVYFSEIKINNFEQTIGVSEQETKELMHYFGNLRKLINPNSGAKNIINRKICNLRTQEYDLCFYMSKIHPKRENVKFGITLQKKGTKEIIVKTLWNVISIDQIHQNLILLKEQANSFDDQTDTISFSMFNKAVELNISKSKLKETDSVEKSQLNIRLIFPKGIRVSKVDSEDNPETKKENPFNTPKSFTSTLTLENITNFITKVEYFFDNKVNNELD